MIPGLREGKLGASARVTLVKALAKVPLIPKPDSRGEKTKTETKSFKPGTIDHIYHGPYMPYIIYHIPCIMSKISCTICEGHGSQDHCQGACPTPHNQPQTLHHRPLPVTVWTHDALKGHMADSTSLLRGTQSVAAVEQMWHISGSHCQILALAFR